MFACFGVVRRGYRQLLLGRDDSEIRYCADAMGDMFDNGDPDALFETFTEQNNQLWVGYDSSQTMLKILNADVDNPTRIGVTSMALLSQVQCRKGKFTHLKLFCTPNCVSRAGMGTRLLHFLMAESYLIGSAAVILLADVHSNSHFFYRNSVSYMYTFL